MERSNFLHWLDQIYSTTTTEIDCDQLQSLLPAYVDYDVAGDDPGGHVPQVKAHLAQCPDCAEDYKALRAVAELEAQGSLPHAEDSLAQFEAEPAASEEAHAERIPA